MSFDWYHRAGVDPWQMSACDEHGAQLVELGFRRGVSRSHHELGPAELCTVCRGSASIADVRACRCNELGTPCPIHGPKPAGAPGEWSQVQCTKCSAKLQLPAERIAFEHREFAGRVAVDVTGWARRNGEGDELRCPFHGAASYFLEYVSGPGADDEAIDMSAPSGSHSSRSLKLTDERIDLLADEAAAAGNLYQVGVCRVALDRDWDDLDLSVRERQRLTDLTREAARAICARAISR